MKTHQTHTSMGNCLITTDVEPSAITKDSSTGTERVCNDILRLSRVIFWVVDRRPCLGVVVR